MVLGEGPLDSLFVILGEAPGKEEDESGRPFVGKSGKLLRGLLRAEGLMDDKLYITNTVKCRPPDNRVPSFDEIKSCSFLLQEELKNIRPILLVAVGGTALSWAIPKEKIMTVHGKILTSKRGVKVFPMIHPAAALRNPAWMKILVADIRILSLLSPDVLRGSILHGLFTVREI